VAQSPNPGVSTSAHAANHRHRFGVPAALAAISAAEFLFAVASVGREHDSPVGRCWRISFAPAVAGMMARSQLLAFLVVQP